MSCVVAPIVEGHGDVAALPLLLRMIDPTLSVSRPVRFPRSRLLADDDSHLHRAAAIAASNITGRGVVLLVLDADEDCAAQLGPKLESRLRKLSPQCECRVALAVREFEAWIVGGDAAYDVQDADTAGNLKDRIRERHGVYGETADQPRLIANADLTLLEKRSRSFRHLLKTVREFPRATSPPT